MSDRADLLARLATAVAASPGVQSLTWRLCDATRRLLGADGASISMDSSATSRVTLCATDEVAAELENLHDVLGEGPATEAYRTGSPVVVPIGQGAMVWSVFAEAAARQTNAATFFAVPMRSGTTVLGVMSLYRSTPGDLAEPLEQAAFLADAVAAAVLHDSAFTAVPGEGGSWSNRAEIHQATGMVIAQLAVEVRDAMAIMRAHAFALDTSLAEIARAVLERKIVFSKDGAT